MKQKAWQSKIKKCCVEAGTYRAFFDNAIDTLAAILEKRDDCEKEYVASGSKPVMSYINKFGAENTVKNPLLVLWDDLNKSALAYWRDLGLTPAGLKKIDEAALKGKPQSALEKALSELG